MLQIAMEGQCPATGHCVTAVLLGDMSIRSMHSLDMFAQGTGVCVAFGAAWDLADIGFLPECKKSISLTGSTFREQMLALS